VLHDVERRTLLVEPAGKGALPLAVTLAHVHLRERAGIGLGLPRRGLLARTQPQDHIARTHRLTGFEGDVAGLPVALVEQPQHRDPLRHRRRARGQRGGVGDVGGHHFLARPGLGRDLDRVRRGGLVLRRVSAEPAATGQRQRRQHICGGTQPMHQAPGVQAS